MRLDFDWSDDGRYHQYCAHCHAETVSRVLDPDGRTHYRCATCGRRHERSIVLDPAVRWWLDADGEYWHESAGVFVFDAAGRLLLFERTLYPFALTVPAGHVDAGEEPAAAAARELREEVGLTVAALTPLGRDDIPGDRCRRGSDAHRWHSYTVHLDRPAPPVQVTDEGHRPQWRTIRDALTRDLTHPVRHLLTHYRPALPDPGRPLPPG
ncbi:MAG TPA: NUDIX hydrolase [Mycobacteriales bacterium]|nr:NUDIX hydrolase [Mycobacteriales bacterium]